MFTEFARLDCGCASFEKPRLASHFVSRRIAERHFSQLRPSAKGLLCKLWPWISERHLRSAASGCEQLTLALPETKAAVPRSEAIVESKAPLSPQGRRDSFIAT